MWAASALEAARSSVVNATLSRTYKGSASDASTHCPAAANAGASRSSAVAVGKLRGQVHLLHGVKTVVTYDAAVLLRSPQDKAKAWEDLCLAMEVSQPVH